MRFRSARLAAAVLALTLGATGCSSDEDPSARSTTSSTPTSTAVPGCDGPAAPAFRGTTTAYGQQAKVETGGALGTQADPPVLTAKPSGSSGWAIAQVSVEAAVLTNGIFAVGPDSFSLVDAAGRQCARPKANPLPDALNVTEVDEKTDGTGSVAFLVPAGASLSRYRVLYHGKSRGVADAAWSAVGSTPTTTTATVCSDQKSPFRFDKSGSWTTFGKQATVGDAGTVAVRLTGYTPLPRVLAPSDRHPNNVSGVTVNVRVEAVGSVAFVDRNMFQLVDRAGRVCGYSQLGTEGETLSSDLVKVGAPKTYTLIFWVPKGSNLTGWHLLYRTDATTTTSTVVWNEPNAKP